MNCPKCSEVAESTIPTVPNYTLDDIENRLMDALETVRSARKSLEHPAINPSIMWSNERTNATPR